MPEIVGRVEREDALVAFDKKQPFEQTSPLVVQKIFVPFSFGQFWNDDNDASFGLLSGQLKNVLHDRHDHEPIGRRQVNEFRRRIASVFERLDDEAVPFFAEDFRVFVGFDVNRDDVGGEARSQFEPMPRDLAIVIDGDYGDRLR